MPSLPPQFSATIFGTPLWIAHPGSTSQHRAAPALHAYELEDHWKIHRDQYDPDEAPGRHILFDAPEVPLACLAAAFAGFVTFFLLERREREKKEDDRKSWLPALMAVIVAALVGVAIYILAALVRVSLSPG
ncbi:MAG: hypothetical protein WB809_04035 [Thermoplasmata archaeon]